MTPKPTTRQLDLYPKQAPSPSTNPLSAKRFDPAVDLTDLDAPTVHQRRRRSTQRTILELRRRQTAAHVVEQLTKRNELYGFTKGQFSIIDLITAALERTGPAQVAFSTWTAARGDVTSVFEFLETGAATAARFLLDISFQRRQPALAQRIRETFGPDAIRIGKTHAKFYLVANADWRLVIRTSMNLNLNPRFQDFTIANDPELYTFLDGILQEIWRKQKARDAFKTPYAIEKHWRENL